MRKLKIYWVPFIVLFLCFSVALGGCKKGEKEQVPEQAADEEKQDIVLHVGEKAVSFDEVMFYVLCVREQYEGYFGKEIWGVNFGNGKTFEDMCKDDILNEIVQLKVITAMAEKENVVVTEDEAEEIADTVREQLEEIDEEDAKKYHITSELLEKIYHDNYLSSKMFDVVTSGVDTFVPEEEARRATFQVITLLKDGVDKNGNEIRLSEEERETVLEKAEELLKQAENGADFTSLATVHSNLEEIEMTIGKGEMEAAFDETAFALKTGKLSNLVEGEKAFYIIYCVDEKDEDATAEAKEQIIEERQDKAFKELYEQWLPQYKVKIEEELWKQITFEEENQTEEMTQME